jgi:hypothetical protein
MKRYEGKRANSQTVVTVNGQPLNPRFDLWNHSPTGFEWGYGGSGPAQLALAILADALDNDAAACRWHQEFKFTVVAGLPEQSWSLTDNEIRRTVQAFATT